jgi:hypothetical protein
MIQFTAKLRFPTGETAWALLEATTPKEVSRVDYEGAVDMLPDRPEHASALIIERLFRQFGRKLGTMPAFSCGHPPAHVTH